MSKYYCENFEGIIINTGTFVSELFIPEDHDIFEISKEDFNKIKVGITTVEEVERLSEE